MCEKDRMRIKIRVSEALGGVCACARACVYVCGETVRDSVRVCIRNSV